MQEALMERMIITIDEIKNYILGLELQEAKCSASFQIQKCNLDLSSQ